MQADEDPLIQVLPSTGATISVSFYDTAVHKLASEHDIIRALLGVCPRERKGSYTAATVDLMNAAGMPAALVSRLPLAVYTVFMMLSHFTLACCGGWLVVACHKHSHVSTQDHMKPA